MADRHAYRAAETLETDVIEEARLLGESIVSGFKPSASIKFLDKDEFIKECAKVGYEGDREAAYKQFTESGVLGVFDPLKNEAFYTLREDAPSYKSALRAAVHEVYGHGYINEMRAVKEGSELKKKMMRGEASEIEAAKAVLAEQIFQLADEGFAYWVSAKADEKMKSDRKHFAKYDQTRLDAWELLEHEPSSSKETSDFGEQADASFQKDCQLYEYNAKWGRVIYHVIEQKLGERAVLSAAKAVLDVPLDKIISDDMAEFHITSKDTPTAESASVLCSKYVHKRLNAISNYSGAYPNDPADFEKKARKLANSRKKPSPDVDVNRYLGIQIIEPKSGK